MVCDQVWDKLEGAGHHPTSRDSPSLLLPHSGSTFTLNLQGPRDTVFPSTPHFTLPPTRNVCCVLVWSDFKSTCFWLKWSCTTCLWLKWNVLVHLFITKTKKLVFHGKVILRLEWCKMWQRVLSSVVVPQHFLDHLPWVLPGSLSREHTHYGVWVLYLFWCRSLTRYMWARSCVQPLGCVCFFATLWTVDRQAPLSMGFARQEYWRELLCPPPGNLPDPGSNLCLLCWQADSLPMSHLEALPDTWLANIFSHFFTFFMVSFKKQFKKKFLKKSFFFFCCHLWLVLYLRRVLSNAKAKIHSSFLLRLS